MRAFALCSGIWQSTSQSHGRRLGGWRPGGTWSLVTILAFDFLAQQPATPRGIHDREYIAGVASPSQAEKLARSQRAETRHQEDGAVTDVVKARQCGLKYSVIHAHAACLQAFR
jgi:hypothetical protein